jgi:hypothetical protein
LKKYILFFVTTLAVITVRAQSGYNYQEFGISAGASYIRGYTNITKQYNHPAFDASFIYNYNPYFPIEAEIQVGQLSGGGLTQNLDPFGRQYVNNYKALILHADFQLGAQIDYENRWFYNIIKDFYVGGGLGVISNTNKVQRTNVILSNGPPTYVFPGKDSSIDFMIPIRFGYEFKIYDSYNEPGMAIDIGYVHNFAFGEGLDGYNDPQSKFKNNAIDQYRQFQIVFKYYFGNVTSYNKLIRTFR